MADYWHDCFDPAAKVSPKEFEHLFCRVCRNQECTRSAGSKDRWLNRMTTQVDRLLVNPKFADPNDPQFRDIRATDFPSAVREAMRLEISDRRGDWSVPSEADALDLAVRMTTQPGRPAEVEPPPPDVVPPVEDDEDDEDDVAVGTVLRSFDIRGGSGETYKVQLVEKVVGRPEWACTCKAFEFGRARPCKHIDYARTLPAEDPPEPAAPPPAPPPPVPRPSSRFEAPAAPPKTAPAPAPVPAPAPAPAQPARQFYPSQANIPMPSGGVMIDGSPPPPPKLRPDTRAPSPRTTATVADPWAAPPTKKPDNVVPVGGRVVLGATKEKK